jgi:LacI family transcriptional regulator
VSVTRKDVARLAGVSTATVSYVVNNGPRPVSEATRQRVLWAIDQLGYQPSAIARSLVTKKTHSIGFILTDILNPVHAAITKGIEDALHDAGFSLIIGISDETPDREQAYLRILLSKQVDGIALTPTGENRRELFSLVDSGKPLVLLDRQLEGLNVDCILFDNVNGTYQAVRHLIALGHTRIGLINLSRCLTPGQERRDGYERALLEAGIEVDSRLITEGSFKGQEGDKLAASLLDIEPPPTALFVSSNRLMRGVLRVVTCRKLRVPQDLAIAAFDDVGHYSHRTPTITAVNTSVTEFGSEAARVLVERISEAYVGEPRVVRVPCQLQIRESTAGMS